MNAPSIFAVITMLLSLTVNANAQTTPPPPDTAKLVSPELIKNMRTWLDTEIVRLSINTQNKRYRKLTQTDIQKLDTQWRNERKASDKPLIAATLSNPLSLYLARMQGRSIGLFVEIFIMDNKGLNVGQSSITSDFWQGDEAKYQKSFLVGPEAIFIDKPEWDEKFKIWRVQVNLTLTGSDQKTAIGAATVELNLSELQRRKQSGVKG